MKALVRCFVQLLLPVSILACPLRAAEELPVAPHNKPLPVSSPESESPTLVVLGPNDEITVRSLQAKEVADKTFRIDQNGEVNFPLLGRLNVSGKTVRETESLLAGKLKTYYLEPDIAIAITALHTESVSIVGGVQAPGAHQIRSDSNLLGVLALAGGVRADAGPVVKITRQKEYGPIPHPSAQTGPTGASTAEIDLKTLLEERNAAENILVKPHDVISIPLAEVVYVIGNVKRSGGFPLAGKPSLSVLQALALAEGIDARAAPKRARILRRGATATAAKIEIPVDINKIFKGEGDDIILLPNDILFVPASGAKTASARAIEAMIQAGVGLAFRL